jgi:mannose-6-phosphate isomerase-like protein (cupin superfamily)
MLTGSPQTAGMRSGFVHLKDGQSIGWHSTGKNEETLVVLHGKGKAFVEGKDAMFFEAPALVYIPPETRHNIQGIGNEVLEYEYVVAPARIP